MIGEVLYITSEIDYQNIHIQIQLTLYVENLPPKYL